MNYESKINDYFLLKYGEKKKSNKKEKEKEKENRNRKKNGEKRLEEIVISK